MQFGFRKGVSTEDAFFLLSTTIRFFTCVRQVPAFVCFVDLRKAFPLVLRSKVLDMLLEKGAPRNTVRALGSLFSSNSCSLRLNSFLSRSFLVNRVVKEGGINSPSVFSVTYAKVLESVGFDELPEDLMELDQEKVYYFVFADDLALLATNLTLLNEKLNSLDSALPGFGMSINRKKTEWVPFVPPPSRYQVDIPDDFSVRIGSERLSCVSHFTYLGFKMNMFLGSNDHLKAKRSLLFSAARTAGKLFRQLEITNLLSLRTYFLSFVSSQLYGLCFFQFLTT